MSSSSGYGGDGGGAAYPYLFISAPAAPTKADVLVKLRPRISDLVELLVPLTLPDFKVGTLDSLVVLSDELAKTDQTFEAITNRVGESMKSLLNNDLAQWKSNLSVNDRNIEAFLKNFQWNTMKYRSDKSLRELTDMITLEVNSIDTLMKAKMTAYSQVKGQLQSILRKQSGNLAVRSLNDIVKKENFLLESEYMMTVLVAVPNTSLSDWAASYERLAQMVVPRSAVKIASDEEYTLFSVIIFQKVLDEFTVKAREGKFIVRDFKWDPQQLANEKKLLADTSASERELWSNLLRLSKTNFGELFSAWMHIKVLRVYVESVLRYGLPPDFQAILLRTSFKNEKKLLDALTTHYRALGGAGIAPKAKGNDDTLEENVNMMLGEKEYFPIVLLQFTPIA